MGRELTLPKMTYDDKHQAAYEQIGENHEIQDAVINPLSGILIGLRLQYGSAHGTLCLHEHRLYKQDQKEENIFFHTCE